MADSDREHWDGKYASGSSSRSPGVPERFRDFADVFASARTALDLACGAGKTSVWLALQGVDVVGVDISPVAVEQATALAAEHGVSLRCSFRTADLDAGLPPGDPVDLVLCHLFRKPELYDALFGRLRPGGHLALAVLSEVGASPGRYRVSPGELFDRFSAIPGARIIADHESAGTAWVLVRRTV